MKLKMPENMGQIRLSSRPSSLMVAFSAGRFSLVRVFFPAAVRGPRGSGWGRRRVNVAGQMRSGSLPDRENRGQGRLSSRWTAT